MCQTWNHQACLHMNEEEFEALSQPTAEWFCARCRLIKSNRISWGDHIGEENIRKWIKSTYATIVGWKKNIFRLPRGNCGSDFIKELTRLINLFVDKTKWERLALSIAHVFIPLMLQKPSRKSKPREHIKYLTSRLGRWKNGQLKSLMDEACEIQSRLLKIKPRPAEDKTENNQKAFVNLMLLGKIGDAAKKSTMMMRSKGSTLSVRRSNRFYNKNIQKAEQLIQMSFFHKPAHHHKQLCMKKLLQTPCIKSQKI